MSFNEQRAATADGVTLELWRLAESGNVAELAAVLPRVSDIDARNEHGMTALMRAAQNGHVKVVRLLLAHGADANIIRNDRFTALALAAFFGHTQVVRTLMEHGADSKAATRGGTSPYMWATARTFDEVADHLEERGLASVGPPAKTSVETPPKVPVQQPAKAAVHPPAEAPVHPPAKVPLSTLQQAAVRAYEQAAREPLVIKTLKDPPEIWDLVHEVPKGFNARSAFLSRLQSMKRSWAFGLTTVIVLIAACGVGVLVLRGVQARSAVNPTASKTHSLSHSSAASLPAGSATVETSNAKAETSSATTDASVATAGTSNVTAETSNTTSTTSPQTSSVTAESTAQPSVNGTASGVVAPSVYVRPVGTRRFNSRVHSANLPSFDPGPASPVAASPPTQAAPVIEKPSSRSTSAGATKTNAPLSPQLIAPARSTQQPKNKVIQWP